MVSAVEPPSNKLLLMVEIQLKRMHFDYGYSYESISILCRISYENSWLVYCVANRPAISFNITEHWPVYM